LNRLRSTRRKELYKVLEHFDDIYFKFPIYYDGKEGRAIWLFNETTVETVI